MNKGHEHDQNKFIWKYIHYHWEHKILWIVPYFVMGQNLYTFKKYDS